MIGSRLKRRQSQLTVNVISRGYNGGGESDTAVHTGLNCTYEETVLNESDDDWGRFRGVICTFRFERLPGDILPTIVPRQFIVNGSAYYEVMDTLNQGGQGNRLKVRCKKWQDSA